MNFNLINFGLNSIDIVNASYLGINQLTKLQNHRLRLMVDHVNQVSPFYKKLYSNIDLNNFKIGDLPVVNKNELMRNFNRWVCDPEIEITKVREFVNSKSNIGSLYLGKYVVWESSGTSGNPGIFLQDAKAMAIYDAVEAARKSPLEILRLALNPLWLGEKVAFLGATEGHFASNVSFERLKAINPLMKNVCKSFSILDPLEHVVSQLNEFSPSLLITYPTAAMSLAEQKSSGTLTISPDEIWTGGETLTKSMRSYIERIFKSRVRNSYGASEFLPIARECERGNLHVNSDWIILEAVDEKNRLVPDGHMSHTTLLTNLANDVKPLVRYDIGDKIRFHTARCPCGSNFPAIDVMGRRDGVLKVSNDEGRPLNLLPLAITTVIEEDAGIFDFQISQQDKTTLVLRLPYRNQHSKRDIGLCKAALQKYLNKQGAGNIVIITESDVQLTLSKSGKLNRVLTNN